MNTRIVNALIVAALSVALAAPALGAETNVIDVKKVEAQIIAAQGQVAAGQVEAGLTVLQQVKAQAVTVELAARAAFVSKLAEARLVGQLGDPAKVLVVLNDVFGQAKQPDQLTAVWQTGLAVTQAAVAVKAPTAGVLVDFLAKGPGPAMQSFAAQMELARLRLALGNLTAAEAELRAAAARAAAPQEWTAWVAVVGQLATATDAGRSPRAGAEVFERMRPVGKPVAAALDVAQARLLLSRSLLGDVEALADRAASTAGTDEQVLAVVSLGYDLALAVKKAGGGAEAQKFLAKAESLAQSRPVSAALATIRGNALTAFGQPGKAVEVFWVAALAVKTPKEQEQMLTAFGAAMVAAGDSAGIVAKLQAAKASSTVYVAVAGAMVKAGDSGGALKLLGAVPAQAFVDNPQAVAGIAPLMQQIQAQRQQIAKDQGARVKAVAGALDAAAKASKDPKAAEALAKQAAALTALAGQVEK
jgi:hypothetical protein